MAPMRVTMLLCDHAEVADNKLFINGAGWDACPAPSPPHAVAMLLLVPWAQTNRAHAYRLALLDEDGTPVMQPGPDGPLPVEVTGGFEVGRPPGVPHGVELSIPVAVNVAPLPLRRGTGYRWQLVINDEADVSWSVSFRTQ